MAPHHDHRHDMTAYITTIDDGTLRISELVGDHAIEVARIKIRRTDHNTITALVANLLPYLAGASGILATPRAHTNGDTPAPSEPKPNRLRGVPAATTTTRVAADRDRVHAYIAAHPGVNGADALRALGLDPRSGAAARLGELLRAGRLRREGERNETRWYVT
jgi:hypothetical protein